jgi:hypothetical protein
MKGRGCGGSEWKGNRCPFDYEGWLNNIYIYIDEM